MLTGHEQAWARWHGASAAGRLHHAWLLVGRKGLGKASFALAAAREIVGALGTGEHPDILVLSHGPKDEKEERKRSDGKPYELARSIRIAQVRAMQQRLTTRPTSGERRAIIVDPADDLERNAANALLKSLEEPPSGTYFLLVSHRPSRLLPTIRSRCQTLRFPDLDDAAMRALLGRLAPEADADTREAALAAAAGSPGAAQAFVAMNLGNVAQAMTVLLRGDTGPAARGRLAEAIGAKPDRERMQAIFDLARAKLAQQANTPRSPLPAVIAAHAELVRLGGESPTFNYDPGLLGLAIAGLLADVGAASTRADG